MASRTPKSLAGIRCFLTPRKWFSLGTEHLLLLVRISSQWTRQTVEPTWVRQLWLNLQTENLFCPHIYSCFCWLSHIFLRRNRTTKPTQQGELRKKNALAEHERARNSLIFCCWCKHQTPGCKRLKVKWKINFSTRQTFPLLSFANSYFLFSNFAVQDFIFFTLDFNT